MSYLLLNATRSLLIRTGDRAYIFETKLDKGGDHRLIPIHLKIRQLLLHRFSAAAIAQEKFI